MLIGYARVSTQDQNPDLQIDALKSLNCEKIYHETASGAQRDRPELINALNYIRKGDTLVVWKLDRLARSLKQLIETVEELDGRGIALRSITEAIDTSTAGGKLVFHIFGALAEFERGIIRERTMSGLESARKRGRLGGRPPSLSEQQKEAIEILLKNSQGTVADIAKQYNTSVATIYRYFPKGRSGFV